MKNIIIIGSRGYKFEYGGWETFVTNLIDNYEEKDTIFYVPELSFEKEKEDRIDNGVRIHPIYVKPQGNATMLTFAIKAVFYYKKFIKENHLDNVVMYILGCRVGPLFTLIHKKLKRMGIKIVINPDGLEWKREKWNFLIKKYFKISERGMIKSSNQVVCDSKAILSYVNEKYKKYSINSTYIAYGAYLKQRKELSLNTLNFFQEYGLKPYEYYLFVGRFVPENNIEYIIKEFMKSKIQKDFVIVSNVTKNKFYQRLVENTNFLEDKRIKFVGSLYDDEILRQVRMNATAYIHGHSAGGTNPSLLEALSTTEVNILFDVAYNREVGEENVLYFKKEPNSLKNVLETVELFSKQEREKYGVLAKERIKSDYTWNLVAKKYAKLFERLINEK